MNIRRTIAAFIVPNELRRLDEANAAVSKRLSEIDIEVNQRVADIISKMDPFEPFLKKYNVIFSEEWEHAEDLLSSPERIRLYQWAYGARQDPSFNHLVNFIMNTQGNATLRKAKSDPEWFFGRSAIVTIQLLVKEVWRLSSYYETMMARDQEFNPHLSVES